MSIVLGACPRCGWAMVAIAGLRSAVCRKCGFKDGCCLEVT